MLIPLSAIIAVTAILCVCTGDYNPFADPANAAMVTVADSSSLRDGAAIPVYTTRQLVLMAAVREMIDSFTVHADSNRYFKDTVVRSPGQARYSFPVSIVDTGVRQMVVVTHRRGGGRSVLLVSLRVYSPLHQVNLDTLAGTQITFTTPAVGDSVWYHWTWGDTFPDTVHSRFPQRTVMLEHAGNFAGRLWVSQDKAGGVSPTPSTRFMVTVNDRSGPDIVCLADSMEGSTALVGADVSYLTFDIRDANGILSVRINDQEFAYQSSPHYKILLRNMSGFTRAAPYSVHVIAKDNYLNETTRRFSAAFDPALSGVSGTRIEVSALRNDTIIIKHLEYLLVGHIFDNARRRVILEGTVDSTGLTPQSVPIDSSSGSGVWGMPISLKHTSNTVVLRARDTAGVLLAEKTITIFQNPDIVDIQPPTIFNLAVNGKDIGPGNNLVFIDNDTALITMAVFDNSGIKGVSLNGTAAVCARGDRPFEWSGKIGAIPHDAPLDVRVVAKDSLDLTTPFLLRVQENTVPSLPPGWQWPGRLFAGTPVSVSLNIIDDDNNVSAVLLDAPPAMSLLKGANVNTWILSWTPAIADTGYDTVRLSLNDGKAPSVIVPWRFNVLRDSSQIVRFSSTTSGFPTLLQAGRDTLRENLALAAQGGAPAFRYKATLVQTGRTVFDSTVDTRKITLSYVPVAADTGVQMLAIVVTDVQGDSDTLLHGLTIVPANKFPCSLQVNLPPGTPMTSDGAIDMSWARSPDTIRLVISDQDDPLTEAYTVTTQWSNMAASQVAVSGREFTLVLDTLSTRTRDTIRVIVADLTGTRDTVVIRVNYMPFMLKKSFTVNTTNAGNGAGVASTVTSFPLALRIPGGVLDSTGLKAGTQYLRFSRTGRETLRFEVERWAGIGDSTVVWVLVDTIFGNNADQVVQMAVTQSAAIVVSNSKTVFDSSAGFEGVWHLARLTPPPITTPDASGSANDMLSGTGVGNSNVVKGIIGYGFTFNGSSNYLHTPSPATTLQFTTQMSISAWVKPSVLDTGTDAYHDILARRYGTEWSDAWLITLMNKRACFVAGMGDTNRVYGPEATVGQWMHIAGVRNGRDIRLYVNGRLAGTGVATSSAFAVDANDVSIGAQQNDLDNSKFIEFFDGLIDEVRGERVVRGADWIRLCYETQKVGSGVVGMR